VPWINYPRSELHALDSIAFGVPAEWLPNLGLHRASHFEGSGATDRSAFRMLLTTIPMQFGAPFFTGCLPLDQFLIWHHLF
jgi:hypothetical protein